MADQFLLNLLLLYTHPVVDIGTYDNPAPNEIELIYNAVESCVPLLAFSPLFVRLLRIWKNHHLINHRITQNLGTL